MKSTMQKISLTMLWYNLSLKTVRASSKGNDEEVTKEVDGNNQGLIKGNSDRYVRFGNNNGQEEGESMDRSELKEQ
jgi:hypothetical protein